MKSEMRAAVASTTPVADEAVVVQKHKLPLTVKVAGAHPANPNLPINLNYLYGFNDQQPQHWVNQNIYVILWLGVLWLVAFLPTHLVLRKIFAAPSPAATRPGTIKHTI